ncbi:hypothetical protein ACFL9T_04105 [Thermodesulfobacteriota bacterium]
MKRVVIIFLLFLIFSAAYASAGEMREVELDDGSVIYGEIVSLEGDLFTIKSDTLGLVKVKASKIRNIQMTPGTDGTRDQFQELQQSMMKDPEILKMIFSLQDDPEVQAILKDPAVLEAVSSGDIEALLSNPKILKLLNNPKIQEIGKKALK